MSAQQLETENLDRRGEPAPAKPPRQLGAASSAAESPDSYVVHHLTILLISLVVVLASLSLNVHNEGKVVTPWLPVQLPSLCHFRNLTGLDCPGCGLTRSFISLANGDWVSAWSLNPASLVMFPFIVAQVPYRSWQLWRIRCGLPPARWGSLGNWFTLVVVVALVTQWLVKMSLFIWS